MSDKEKEINSHILKLTGRAESPVELEIGHNYDVSCSGSIISETLHDLNDGRIDKVYTFKPATIEVLTPKGQRIKLKDSRTRTQLLRGRMYGIWSKLQTDQSFEDWWDAGMVKIIQHADELAGMYFD